MVVSPNNDIDNGIDDSTIFDSNGMGHKGE